MKDITDRKDIVKIVISFYEKVQVDKIIGPLFALRIEKENWAKHLERMTDFWDTVLFGTPGYRGNPFVHHISLGINEVHFDRWISLFNSVIESSFTGPKASEALLRAKKMRELFEMKLDRIKTNPNQYPIM